MSKPQVCPAPKQFLITMPPPVAPVMSMWIVAAFHTGGGGNYWSVFPAGMAPEITLEAAVSAAKELGPCWHHRRVYELKMGPNVEEETKK